MIKPDGVQRSIIGDTIQRFEQRGYSLKALKLFQASEELLRQHYGDLTEKKFFPALLEYMLSGPVTCMVWEGENAVKMGRQMLGATNPQESLPGTIRGDSSIEVGRNICHGSDSVENAEKEIKLWFGEGQVCEWESHSNEWVNELVKEAAVAEAKEPPKKAPQAKEPPAEKEKAVASVEMGAAPAGFEWGGTY